MKATILALLILTPSLFSQSPRDANLIYFGAGIFNVMRNQKAANFQLELRSNFPIYSKGPLFIRPLVGGMGTTRGSGYIYGGIAFDIFLTPSCVFTPSFAPGIYFKGSGMDLGFPLEFRSAVELTYRTKKLSRFGAMFYHMSNASIGHKNPGTECLVFFYGVPF